MKLNFRVILKLLSLLTLFNSLFMLITIPFAIYYQDDLKPILYTLGVHWIIGGAGFLLTRNSGRKDLRKRDGLLVVTMGWILMSLLGSLPYILSNSIPDFTNAFFESISGYTTTGASILDDIESLPKSILVWRSLTQWIGGMGMIVLVVAIMPIIGVGSVQLFAAESPGLKATKITPRIADTAKRLWLIYLGLTIVQMCLLMVGNMNFFDAINHSFTTISTGGFSTKQGSIGHYDSAFIHYVISLFMFIGGTSFVLLYFLVTFKLSKLRQNEEFRYYLWGVLSIVVFVTIGLTVRGEAETLEENFRMALFQVVSLVTTTGFSTVDYLEWGHSLSTVCFVLLLVGGSAGSTAGGMKIIRHIVLVKSSLAEVKKQLHPQAIIPVRINKKGIPQETISSVLAFGIVFLFIITVSSIFISGFGMDFGTSLSAAASALGNVGPGIGAIGPSNNFNFLPSISKWLISFLMLVGRLELFTVLVLFSPYFWRNR